MVKKIIIISLAIAVCAGVVLYSQKGDEFNPFNGTNESNVTYTESQTINLPMEKVRTLNPITSKDADTYQISKLIFDSLFYLDDKLSLVNGLASNYTYASDKKSVTIDIKTDAYFSNGDNLTAWDVKYSIDNYIAAAASGNTIYSSYVSNIKSAAVNKNDDYSINVKFKDKRDVSMENFVFPIVSEKNFGKSDAYKVASSKFIPIGSGPYAIEKYNEISDLKLSANEHYTGVRPTNVLSFEILPNRNDVIPLIEVNNVSLGFLEDLSRDTLISDKKIISTNFISNEVEVVGYNFNKEAMANKKVRKAIAYAIDNEALNESAYYKNGVLCDTIYYPGYAGNENTGDHYKVNLEKAQSLLSSANYLDLDGNGYLEDKDKKELTIEILVNETDPSRKIVAEAIKTSLDKLSISSRIIYASSIDDFNNKLNGKDFDIFVGGIKINETYDLRSFLHSDYYNMIGYSNKKVDILLDKLKSGISNEQKTETVKKIKDIIIDELPYYCIAYKTSGALSAKCLQGDSKNYMFNNHYGLCNNWYCKYEVKENPNVETSDKNNISEN